MKDKVEALTEKELDKRYSDLVSKGVEILSDKEIEELTLIQARRLRLGKYKPHVSPEERVDWKK